jgi:signal transduction histidine kinase
MPWTTPLRGRQLMPRRLPLRQAAWSVTAVAVGAAEAATDTDGALPTVAGALFGALALAVLAMLAYRLRRQARGVAVPPAPASASALAAAAGAATTDAELLVDSMPLPALLLVPNETGWTCRHANVVARQSWPQIGADNWPAGLPERLAAPGAAADNTWQLLAGPSWLLAWRTSAATPLTCLETPRRLESETFGFTLSHDLRAPLRVVEGFARIVKEDYGEQLDRVGNDHLDRVIGAAVRMHLMIDAMLSLARLSQQPLSRQRVDLSEQAGCVIDELRRGAPERVVAVDIEPGLQAEGDPTLLRIVLDNLLGNAWKYTANAAHPRVELRREPTSDGTGLGFVVRDNGAGFDMRSADRLFGLFQRLHSASDFPGHGVGLASVRRIVERHGGRIWAESVPGRGASFHVVLGAAEAPAGIQPR